MEASAPRTVMSNEIVMHRLGEHMSRVGVQFQRLCTDNKVQPRALRAANQQIANSE